VIHYFWELGGLSGGSCRYDPTETVACGDTLEDVREYSANWSLVDCKPCLAIMKKAQIDTIRSSGPEMDKRLDTIKERIDRELH